MNLATFALLALAFLPQAPNATVPPPSANLALTAVGFGVQVYRCTPEQGGTFQWVFDSAAATLFDPATHQPLGHLTANPVTWRWNDGSEIAGSITATTPSANPANIPSLSFATHATSTATGALAAITLVRRANAQAGAAPSYGCYAEKANNTIHVPYEATYTFYTATK